MQDAQRFQEVRRTAGKASRGSRQPRGQGLVERGIGSALLSSLSPRWLGAARQK